MSCKIIMEMRYHLPYENLRLTECLSNMYCVKHNQDTLSVNQPSPELESYILRLCNYDTVVLYSICVDPGCVVTLICIAIVLEELIKFEINLGLGVPILEQMF